jgi:pyruvate dehydrogenase E1 component
MASYPHTQWMLGQLTAKLTRIANTPINEKDLKDGQKPLSAAEKPWKVPAEMMLSLSPDVGTSTNLNPAMDGKIFGAPVVDNFEEEFGVKEAKGLDLVPGEEDNDRFIRFEIVEGNAMSAMGSFGMIKQMLGIPLYPLMTVYDFFIKRAHDQFFYNLYWNSDFMLGGTPSGVTLSPEGAQHGWKSDFQIPNQCTWEPLFCQELDWIFCENFKRHFSGDNAGRAGIVYRLVTRGVEQKDMMKYLKMQKRFKASFNGTLQRPELTASGATTQSEVKNIGEGTILETIRKEVLSGAYKLIDYSGYAGYEPGDNVVNLFALGSMGTEAIAASEKLLARGIYANVIIVTNSDLLLGNLAFENEYHHLKTGLNIEQDLYLTRAELEAPSAAELMTVSGRRVPVVSVHDGEPGLLDNIGAILGVKHEALAVRKHSKCGTPRDIYHYHGIDAEAVIEAVGRVLSETALENVKVNRSLLETVGNNQPKVKNWRELWPNQKTH